MQKKVKERILDIMADTPNISRDEVVKLIRKYDDAPNISALVDREYKAKATRLMASFRDEMGVRDIFAIKNKEDFSEFVNVARSREVDDLNKVKKRLEGNIRGNSTSLEKVKERLSLVGKQRVIFYDPKNEGVLESEI